MRRCKRPSLRARSSRQTTVFHRQKVDPWCRPASRAARFDTRQNCAQSRIESNRLSAVEALESIVSVTRLSRGAPIDGMGNWHDQRNGRARARGTADRSRLQWLRQPRCPAFARRCAGNADSGRPYPDGRVHRPVERGIRRYGDRAPARRPRSAARECLVRWRDRQCRRSRNHRGEHRGHFCARFAHIHIAGRDRQRDANLLHRSRVERHRLCSSRRR